MNKTAIITGVTGQDGVYLAKLLLENNYKVIGLTRGGLDEKKIAGLKYLGIYDKVTVLSCNLLDIAQVESLLLKYKPHEIYNLAAQSSVYVSFKRPIETFQFNTVSVFNLLESIKKIDSSIRFYQASSSEMYGKVNNLPITEDSILHPLSPYAISKAAAHFTCIHYRESYNMHISCGVLFNHESYLRHDSFFVKKILNESIKISKGEQEYLYVGNIDVKRDFGYAPKYVEAMFLMIQEKESSDYLICSGHSITLRDIIYYIFDKLNIDKNKCKIDLELYRPAEIQDMFGDNTKAKSILQWKYNLTVFDTLDLLLEEELKNIN